MQGSRLGASRDDLDRRVVGGDRDNAVIPQVLGHLLAGVQPGAVSFHG